MIAYRWPEAVLLYAIQAKLKKHAKSWIDFQEVFKTWAEFVFAFLNDFPYTFNSADVHIELMKSRQGKYETPIDFYYKMLALGRKGKLDDQSIIRHMINGLNDGSTRQTLNAFQFSKCSDFFTALSSRTENARTSLPEHMLRRKESTPMSNKAYTADRTDKGPTCFNCQERGHISKNCPKPQRKQRCPRCNRVHPKQTECKDGVVRNVTCQREEVFQTPVNLGGRDLIAFMDTGSQRSLVRAATMKHLSGIREVLFRNCRHLCW